MIVHPKGYQAMRRRQIFAMQSNALNEPKGAIHEEAKGEAPAQEVLGKACPKCGKVIRQGMFMHMKYCKG